MSGRRGVALAVVLLCISLPGAMALVEGVTFYANNRGSASIRVGSRDRGYVLHVPTGLDRSRPAPLVISLHGAGLWGAAQRDITGWNAVADREGFVVAYPSGEGHASPRIWEPSSGRGLSDDVEFITRVIDTLVATRNVDRTRVYVTGFSNGGGMTFALSCAVPQRIAAAGIMAGAQTHPWGSCADAPPVPVVFFHGTSDPVLPYEGGKTWVAKKAFPNIPDFVRRWAGRNRCNLSPKDSLVSAGVERREYAGCANGADVVLYTLEGEGHVWPGGDELPTWLVGPSVGSIDANSAMWEFFRGRTNAR